MFKKLIKLILALGLVIVLLFIPKNKVEPASYYHPPMKCYRSMTTSYGDIYFMVEGINSTIFCRRLDAAFENSQTHIVKSENKLPKNIPQVCFVIGYDFIVYIYSESIGALNFCEQLIGRNNIM